MAGKLTCNDKMCAAYVEQADGTVCLQVQVKDPGATDPKIDTEIQLLCDTGNGDAKFYAAVQYTDAGDFEVIEPIDLTGAPYTVVGPVEICATEDAKIVVTEACDELADGSRVRFYYLHTVQGGAIIASLAIGANGGAYTPINEIPEVKGEFADDIEVTTVQLCDAGNNNEAYLLHTYHNTTTGANTVVTTELDGDTAYTPITAGSYKPTRCFITEAYIVDRTGLTLGGEEEYWEASATDPGATPPLNEIFTQGDAFGLPAHENPADSVLINTEPGLATFDNPAPGVPHQSCLSAFLTVPKGGAQLWHNAGGQHVSAVFMGGCSEQLKLVSSISGFVQTNLIGYMPEGIYKVKIYVHDDGTFGRARMMWTLPGANRTFIPFENFSVEMPEITSCKALYDKDNNTLTELISGDDIPLTTDGLTFCDPCANTVSGGMVELAENKAQSRIVGRERIVVANGVATGLNPPVDANGDDLANGAIVQVQLLSTVDRDAQACPRYRIDGGDANVVNGFLANHKDYIELGCAASNGALITDDASEVNDFSIHSNDAVGSINLEVVYYAF